MTLTKEQKLALTRVVAYMDEMYAIASPYHGCTEDANILRAMIDSSGTVEPVGGFDLERARGLRDFLQDDCAEVGDVWAEMIAEIERLRSAIRTYREREESAFSEIKMKDEFLMRQNARIKELESLIESSMSLVGCHQRVIEKREKALVEERARYIDDFIHEFDPQEDRLDEARKQLQAEGKIGPDADAKPHCWQITEERKAALWHAINVLKENDIMEEPEEHLWDEEVAVLQAMLTEAGQE